MHVINKKLYFQRLTIIKAFLMYEYALIIEWLNNVKS